MVKEDGKFYEIIYAKKGKSYVTKDIYYEVGEKLIHNKDPLLKEFIHDKIKRLKNIIIELEDKNTNKAKERYEKLNKEILELKEVLKEIESY